MEKFRLGKTNLMVTRSGFGALPIQRISFEDAGKLLRKAYDNGINFFDTARAYSDSEEKIGQALSDVRKNIIIATKTGATTADGMLKDLHTSLTNLKTDYIDIYQLHNPSVLPDPDEKDGIYKALLKVKEEGLIKHISITQHSIENALIAAKSGLYDTVQFPLSCISSDKDLELIEVCRQNDVGVIAMKAMAGGLIRHPEATFAFLRSFGNVIPIWGVQRESELDEFLAYEKNPPALDDKMKKLIEDEKNELSSNFCRGCGYCMPCPAGIEINNCARMSLMLRRAPVSVYTTDEWKEKMAKIKDCIGCGHCMSKCPYHLNTPELLKANLADFEDFVAKM